MTPTLTQLRRERRWTVPQLADRILDTGAVLTDRTNLIRTIRRWEDGAIPKQHYRAILFQVYGPRALLALPDPYATGERLGIDVVEITKRIARSDVVTSTLDDLELAVDGLCSRYSADPPAELIAEGGEILAALLSTLTAFPVHRQAVRIRESAAWLALLLACLHNDIGDRATAATLRVLTGELAADIGHGEILAWHLELLVWFNLTDNLPRAAITAAQQAQQIAPADASVLIQIAGQEAMAWARIGETDRARECLERSRHHIERIPSPVNPQNHFKIDAGKGEKPAMWMALDLGQLDRAVKIADYVLAEGLQPDGTHRMPMRKAEALNLKAVVAAKWGDVDTAARLAHEALDIPRVSAPSLAGNVQRVLAALPAGDERAELADKLRRITAPAAA